MNYYEIILIYDREYARIIAFEDNRLAIDSHGIAMLAVRRGLIEKEDIRRVRRAQSIEEYEYIQIKRKK